MKKELVISRYNENLDWIFTVQGFIKKITIYNKGLDDLNIQDPRVTIVNLENVGREAHTWLHHFIYERDNLADIVFLAQGNPFEHSPDYLARLKHTYFVPKSLTKHYKESWPKKKVTNNDCVEIFNNHEIRMGDINYFAGLKNSEDTKKWLISGWNMLFKTPMPKDYYYYGYGAMWAIPKEFILNRSTNFYLNIYNLLKNQTQQRYRKRPIDAWMMEALWTAVFSKDYECMIT
jgi:hypothetical protein